MKSVRRYSLDDLPRTLRTEAHLRNRCLPETADGCWPWAQGTAHGYGIVGLRKRTTMLARRAAYLIKFGVDIPDNYRIVSRCESRACVRYDADHVQALPMRMACKMVRQLVDPVAHRWATIKAGRRRRLLSDAEVIALRELRAQGATIMRIAESVGLSTASCRAMLSGRTYRDVAVPPWPPP